MLIYGFPPVLCSGDFIALNFRMFIALVLVYKFVIVGTVSNYAGVCCFTHAVFWRQEFTILQQYKSTPCFPAFMLSCL